jgi:hypothetical protein
MAITARPKAGQAVVSDDDRPDAPPRPVNEAGRDISFTAPAT